MEKHETAQFTHEGITFTFRSRATRGDQYEMHAAMADGAEIRDGKTVKAKPSVLYPWIIGKFVTAWSVDEDFSLQKLMDQPATPGEDLILVLGSYIFNHVGIAPVAREAELKKA